MRSEQVDLTSLETPTPKSLFSLALDVGVLHYHTVVAITLGFGTSWRIFPFESYGHARRIINSKPLHVFVTHWHHFGNDTKHKHNLITRLAERVREKRGGPGVGRGPLLVATFNDGADEDFLKTKYDLIISLPFRATGPTGLNQLIADQLFQLLPLQLQHTRH